MTERTLVEFSGSRGGTCALSWGQVAIWRAIQRMVPDDAALNMSWVTDLEGEGISFGTPLSRITDTVRTVVERHESLRTRVRADAGGEPRQVLAATGAIEVHVVEATAGTAAAEARALQARLTDPAYDYPHEWPLRAGAVRVGDVVTHAVFGICHLVTDRGGLTALVRDVVLCLRGEPLAGTADRQPYDQALHQQSEAGRKQSGKALRYWSRHLHAVPLGRFPEGGVRPEGEPPFWSVTLSSPAGDLAVTRLAGREQVSTSAVILAAAAVQLARQTGAREAVLQVIVSNRFRPGLAGSVGPASQDGLCVVDVGDPDRPDDLPVVIQRAMRASLQAYLHAQYDPAALDDLVAAVGAARGGEVDLSASFNDRRFDAQTPVVAGEAVTAAAIEALLPATRLRRERVEHYGARYFLHVNAVPGSLDLTLFADSSVLPAAAVEAHLRGIEALVVEAATTAGAPAPVAV
ncbi:condensation domain-containing protein [Dactylosporangium sp. NPDC050688]|uniref:condensation domain-containing protein n=1 Tax=Dactylosporangium sp. NPDC050688 TaxID=3157217 RepID=UPI0033FF0B0B